MMNNSMEVYQAEWSLEKHLNNLLRKNEIQKSHDFLNHGLRLISFEYPTLLIFFAGASKQKHSERGQHCFFVDLDELTDKR